ncbi:LuxR C-terminal-related transcriptional regulator [Streptomyces sp. NPDC053048]|uniref:helix-turn-helix transcriptional regulator n=1 Tax=Streptomyces sp. NPDC053048 TaxID=3365694 RepID=UPI0037D2017C
MNRTTVLSADGTDELALQIYAWSLHHTEIHVHEAEDEFGLPRRRIEQALDLLVELKLVRFDGAGEVFVGVSPSAAQVELIAPLEEQIHERQDRLAAIHQKLKGFSDVFTSAQRERLRHETVVVPESDEHLRLRLADAARHCSSEMLIMQAGCAGAPQLFSRHIWPVALRLLDRGVRVRTLHQHTARTDAETRTRIHQAMAAGATARTSDDLFGHLVVFDGKAAMAVLTSSGEAEPKNTMIYDPTVVGLLRRFHDHAWHSAVEFDHGTVRYGETLDAVKSTILRLLATGMKDEVVARRLGMSPRTFRRHIASIMDELHAESRFQAGITAARAGLLEAQWPDTGRLPLSSSRSAPGPAARAEGGRPRDSGPAMALVSRGSGAEEDWLSTI